MAERQFVLVVYDISNDRRRTRLHNVLLDFGTPVQYSVFECALDEAGLAQMKKAVMRVIRPRSDRVRFYYLCARCLAQTEVTSGQEVLGGKDETLVV
ncbi:MAG: CRISPR-associated endonuclease Cas2 [Chloroflexi bacterium]|nr:MAG: CRISPR-associated endonuclease Cas2 [Chloroflexota bacterium]